MRWNILPVYEKANIITHATGVILIGIASPIILFKVFGSISAKLFLSLIVFFASALALYLSSVIYHYTYDKARKRVWRKIDHIAIYFLIAGTYQPFIIMHYGGKKGVIFMILMWGLVLAGTLYKIFMKNSMGWVSTLIYLIMGWLVIFISKSVLTAISTAGLVWLIAGGLSYSIGVYFYRKKALPYHHAIWHIFVLIGTLSHMVSITLGVFNCANSL